MDEATRTFVRHRAEFRCEYCRAPERARLARHQIEHIIARQHGGTDADNNLALACRECNLNKGPNLTGIDPASRKVSRLYHPRRDEWRDHFALRGAVIEGLTPAGRTTVRVLGFNDPRRVALREELIADGQFA